MFPARFTYSLQSAFYEQYYQKILQFNIIVFAKYIEFFNKICYYIVKLNKKVGIVMFKKFISVLLCMCMLATTVVITASAAPAKTVSNVNYKITNPYESVTEYLGNPDNHYKTNLHTHSTISDARVTLPEMVKAHYEENFDILAMTDHGVIGKKWYERPTHYYLMRIATIGNSIMEKDDFYKEQYDVLSKEEYDAIVSGTYEFDEGKNFQPSMNILFSEKSDRKYGRGMQCVTSGIELSAASVMECHVNSFFSDFGECYSGLLKNEGNYEYYLNGVENAGGVSIINHPGHYLNSKHNPENALKEGQIVYFGDLLNKYKSCLGIETFNNTDGDTASCRAFWDKLLQYVIPHGERNVFGFSNSDAHYLRHIDTEFMDFILPSYSQDNFRKAMETGTFFATGRVAENENELGSRFIANGCVPQVTSLTVDDENDIITVTAKNAERIEWVANGNVIEKSVSTNEKGELVSVIKLREHSDDITCYVRFQIFGKGGYCYSNAFICDDGNMSRFIIKDSRNPIVIFFDKLWRKLTENIIGAAIQCAVWYISNEIYYAKLD